MVLYPDENHVEVVEAYVSLGVLYFNSEAYYVALPHFGKALEALKSCTGHNDPFTKISGRIHKYIGDAQRLAFRYRAAIDEYVEALQSMLQTDGESNQDIAETYQRMGCMYHEIGDYEMALESQLRAHEMFKSIHNINNGGIDMVGCCKKIAKTYLSRGEHLQALKYCDNSMEVCDLLYGIGVPHFSKGYLLLDMGKIYMKKGEFVKAKEKCNEARAMFAKLLSDVNNPAFAAVSMLLGEISLGLKNTSLAFYYYQNAYKAYERYSEVQKLPNFPTAMASACNQLALQHYKQHEYESALTLADQAKDVFTATDGIYINHPELANAHRLSGDIYDKSLTTTSQSTVLEKYLISLSLYEDMYGTDALRHDLASILAKVGNMYKKMFHYNLAIKYYSRALKIREAIYKTKEVRGLCVAETMDAIADCHRKLMQYEKSLKLYTTSLEIQTVCWDNADMANIERTYTGLGKTYNGLGNYKKAIEYHRMIKDKRVLAKSLCRSGDNFRGRQMLIELLNQTVNKPNSKSITLHRDLGQSYYEEARKSVEINPEPQDEVILNFGHARFHCMAAYNDLETVYGGEVVEERVAQVHTLLGMVLQQPSVRDPDSEIITEAKYTNFQEAIQQHTMALGIRLAIHGDTSNHPELARSYNNVGVVYTLSHELEKATSNLNTALNLYTEYFKCGNKKALHPGVADVHENLGNLYIIQEDAERALFHYEECLSMRMRLFGYNAAEVLPLASIYRNMSKAHAKLGNITERDRYLNLNMESLGLLNIKNGICKIL